jgi:ABC-type transport system involved in multi-copper enzyme maturation permease subunit
VTVYGLEYRPKAYTPTGPFQRLRPLVHSELHVLFRSKWGIGLYGLCVFPVLVRLVMLLGYLGLLPLGNQLRETAQALPPELRLFVPVNIEFYVEQVVRMDQGFFIMLVLTAMATARAVAKDRATNALELYWTRGIRPSGYFFGKWLGAFLLVASITVGAPMLLWVIGVMFAADWAFLSDTIGFMPRALAALAVFTFLLTGLCLLVSAIAASANVATILWCLLLGGSSAVAQVISELQGGNAGTSISVWDAAATLARDVAGIPERGTSTAGALMLMTGFGVVLGWFARRRLRLSEAIG